MKNESNSRFFEYFYKIIITELICIGLIIISVFLIKSFSNKIYSSLKEFYIQNLCVDTDINEVIKTDGETNEI